MEQKKLLLNARKFISSYNRDYFLPYKDSIFYFATYSNFIGSSILNSLAENGKVKLRKNFLTIIKDIFYTLNYKNCLLLKSKKIKKKYDKIFITWAFKNNFSKDGSLNDRYFNINSKSVKETLWIVIYMDKINPKKIAKNIVLFKTSFKKSYNIFELIKFIFNNSIFLFKGLKFFLGTVSNHNYFPKKLLDEIKHFFSDDIKFLIMPYEGQPFQNQIISYLKKKHKNIQSIGYIHSPPLAVPANFIYKSNSPDKIILNGKDQFNCFTKILGWKKKQIKILPSYRFLKKKNKLTKNIFLPIAIQNLEKVLEGLIYLDKNDYIDLKKYSIKNHPAASFTKKNLQLIEKLETLKKLRNTKKKINKVNFQIFIGNSGSIIESLERGANVIQICDHPIFDTYTKEVWPSINSKKIKRDIYIYSLKQKGNLIKLGNKKNNLKKIFYK